MNAAHLDYDTLADLAEGLLSDTRAASADAHLASCAECQDRSTEITDVSRLLADAPVPPMPADLASRIDDALAAEAAVSEPVISLDAKRHKRLRILSAAAATVAVLGGGAIAGHTLLTGSVSSEGSSAQSQPVQDLSASKRAKAPRTETFLGAGGGYLTVQSGTNYTAAGLGGQVSAQLAQGDQARRASVATKMVTGCVRQITQRKTPLLIDVATYEGRPATLIVLPATASGRLDVWVVGPACSASDTALIEHTQTTR